MKDKRLVIKLKNNTAGALDSVIRKYSAYIYTVVYNVLSGKMTEEDIEETVSDAFIKLWQNSGNLREDKPLLPYLSVIALNLARNRLRENKSYAFCITVYLKPFREMISLKKLKNPKLLIWFLKLLKIA